VQNVVSRLQFGLALPNTAFADALVTHLRDTGASSVAVVTAESDGFTQ
jgi:hypothetical protein